MARSQATKKSSSRPSKTTKSFSRLKKIKDLKKLKNLRPRKPSSPKHPKHPKQPRRPKKSQSPTAPNEIIEPLTGSSVFVEPKPPKAEPKKLPKKPTPLERFNQRPKEDHHKIIATLMVLNTLIFSSIAVILLSKTVHANYSDAYQLAKDLKKEVQLIKTDASCTRVTDYANKSFVTADTYETYLRDCQTISDTPDQYISKLSQTEAIKTDDELKQRFTLFTDAYHSATSGSKALALALDQYRIWHQWVISSSTNTSELSWTDAEIESTAKILTESDVPVFARYGKAWQTNFGNFVSASREYYTASFSDENKEELRTKMTDAKKAYEDWQATSALDLKKLLPLENPDITTMSTRFENFYAALRSAYQKNYDPEIGGCREMVDQVICE